MYKQQEEIQMKIDKQVFEIALVGCASGQAFGR